MFFYNLTLQLYKLGILLASPFNRKAKLWLSGRKGIWAKMKTDFQNEQQPVAWFHCASLGEFEQGRNLIESFKTKYPSYKILLTFFSPSGYEIRKNYSEAHYIYYLPLDTKSNAQKFLEICQPKVAFFIKYEFWYHYINEAQKRDIPVLSASAIFRKNQVYFKKNTFWKKLLSKITFFYVQDEQSETLLEQIAITNSLITGDTRFDRVHTLAQNHKKFSSIEYFKGNNQLLVMGSTWSQDIDIVKSGINDLSQTTKVIIAPHEINESNLTYLESNITLTTIRYSKYTNETNAQVLIIDNIGLLSSLYHYADICYIGGAFGKGLHNTLEAATYGNPIIFGPKYEKFNEAVNLISVGAAFSIDSPETFQSTLEKLLNSETLRTQCSNASKSYVQKNTGATNAILTHCDKFITE